MRIAIDCFKQVKGNGKSTGIYNEALNTVKNLISYKESTSDSNIQASTIVVFGNAYNREDFQIPGVEFVNVKNINPLNKMDCVVWELFTVSKYCKQHKIDKILYPRGYNAINNSAKEIVLINDLIPYFYNENFPESFGKLENYYIMQRLKWAAKTADHIVTISEYSKSEIVRYFKTDTSKISIVYCGLNEVEYTQKKEKKPYICAGTSRLPHKNAFGIIKAYIEYFKRSENPLPIVITGIDSIDQFYVPEEIRANITCIGFTKDNNEYYSYIANAKVFLYLSLIEGFGYPPIEAMQMGVPVVCSNRASMPETVADSGVLVDPDDPISVANALEKVIVTNDFREELIQKGLENTKRFSWDNIAKQYWDIFVYQNIS